MNLNGPTKTGFLRDQLDRLNHNLLCYSDGWLMDKPKKGYESDWNRTNELIKFVENWIREEELKRPKKF